MKVFYSGHSNILVEIFYGQSFDTVQGKILLVPSKTLFMFLIWKDYAETNEAQNIFFVKTAQFDVQHVHNQKLNFLSLALHQATSSREVNICAAAPLPQCMHVLKT